MLEKSQYLKQNLKTGLLTKDSNSATINAVYRIL